MGEAHGRGDPALLRPSVLRRRLCFPNEIPTYVGGRRPCDTPLTRATPGPARKVGAGHCNVGDVCFPTPGWRSRETPVLARVLRSLRDAALDARAPPVPEDTVKLSQAPTRPPPSNGAPGSFRLCPALWPPGKGSRLCASGADLSHVSVRDAWIVTRRQDSIRSHLKFPRLFPATTPKPRPHRPVDGHFQVLATPLLSALGPPRLSLQWGPRPGLMASQWSLQ